MKRIFRIKRILRMKRIFTFCHANVGEFLSKPENPDSDRL
jgi:hypothetical protein